MNNYGEEITTEKVFTNIKRLLEEEGITSAEFVDTLVFVLLVTSYGLDPHLARSRQKGN